MLSKKLLQLMHKIALFAIIFASIAPSMSHAMAAQTDTSFAQEICSSDGKKITIQVLTSKGQQLATELAAKPSDKTTPAGLQHHLQHCPFCANPSTDTAIQSPHAPIIAILTAQALQIATSTQVDLPRFSVLPPPAQAPPAL